MDSDRFKAFLKKKGKKQNVIERNVNAMNKFISFLQTERNKTSDEVDKKDIEAYVLSIEKNKQSAKGSLYVLMNYFRFIKDDELLKYSALLREERTRKSRRVFPLKEFMDVDPVHIMKLKKNGIINVDDLLKHCSKKQPRNELSIQLDIPEESLLELVKLSDLTRLGFIKTKLSRLYYNSGLDSPAKIAAFEPDELHAFFVKFIKENGWDGMVPNPGDLVGNIKSARELEILVEE